jgi:benzoate/toluate 1,2-dioxygenase alpha subunit
MMSAKKLLANAIEERFEDGVLRVDRRAYTNPEFLEWEFEHIFEGNWVYLCHESQVALPKDFYTTVVGRQPVLVTRNTKGELKAFINSCAHRGVLVARETKGKRAAFTCPFHGWTYDLNGRLVDVPMEEGAGYPCQFDKSEIGLTPVPRVESYRGFVFVSFEKDVQPVDQWLGDSTTFFDLIVDQAPHGLEVLPGTSSYTYKGNWKLAYENQADGYHAVTTHRNFIQTIQNRQRLSRGDKEMATKSMDLGQLQAAEGGFYDLDNGNVAVWWSWTDPTNRHNFGHHAEYVQQFGSERADWMVNRARNIIIYPNLLVTDHLSVQIRSVRPLAVDLTEVTVHCLGPRNESDKERAHRIRQYEDFFNVSGLGTPDDTSEFEAQQAGVQSARFVPWSDLSRGLDHMIRGPNELAKRLGINPLYSGSKMEDEPVMWAQARHWRDTLLSKLATTEV